ncbi:MAG: MBOAT family O-acyltransferase [Chitinophagaceae bacterium]
MSVCVHLALLGFFKYFNFFTDSFAGLLKGLGVHVSPVTLNIILPVGISFYTFHGLSYLIDVYKKKIEPTNSLVNYAVFVSFFPLLVAGPVERATHLLPQVERIRSFEYAKAVDGLRQILWGVVKKVVIADNCAQYVNMTFGQTEQFSGPALILGAYFFAFQIYGDFSGYTDIALGTARLLGFEVLKNFSFPFFSRSVGELWRRWHISLSSWFRDYVYQPLGSSRKGMAITIRNTFIVFILSGFWHGANWTFITWGVLNGFFAVLSMLLRTDKGHRGVVAKGRWLPSGKEAAQMIITFSIGAFCCIFFRAASFEHGITYLERLFTFAGGIGVGELILTGPKWILPTLISFLLIEWTGRSQGYGIKTIGLGWPSWLRRSFYFALLIVVFIFAGNAQEFIYFQF